MKDAFRQSMAWLHTWVALVPGWILFFVFVTGTAGYFQQEITQWMQPERPYVPAPKVVDRVALTERALDRLNVVAPVAAGWSINFPHRRLGDRGWQEFSIRWTKMPSERAKSAGARRGRGGRGGRDSERLDGVTGETLPAMAEPRETAGGRGLYRMHYSLHYMPYEWAIRIVGICTMLMLLAIVSGVITHKKIFKDFFTFRPGKGQRSWLDAHNAISVMALPFFLMITYSGLVFFLFAYMPAGRDLVYGSGPRSERAFQQELYGRDTREHAAIGLPKASLAPMLAAAKQAWGEEQIASLTIERHDGEAPEVTISRVPFGLGLQDVPKLRFDADTGARLPDEPIAGGAAGATQSVLFNLHEGTFADIWGRWIYFASGLLGCAMVGTGMVLWTVKRRRHHLSSAMAGHEDFGVRLVEILNVATIAGLPLATALFFWANRLLPVDMAERAAWEYHSLFAAWLGTLFFAMARPLHRAWIELSWATCGGFALIPVLNAATTDRHLGQSLAAGDWVFAGFDLTMLALAAMFAVIARRITRRLQPHSTKLSITPAIPAGLREQMA